MRLRAFDRADLAALGALPFAPAHLEPQLCDPDHAGGANAVVADDHGDVAGVAGWVAVGREFYGSPVVARDDALPILVDDLITRARAHHAAWIRIGSRGEDRARLELLGARGFANVFDFVTLAISAAPRASRIDLRRVPIADCDPRVLQAIHDETFAGVPNSGPLSLEAAAHMQALAWPDGSGVWFDGDRAAAFVSLDHSPPIVTIEVIGVARASQRRGIARALVDATIDLAARVGAREVRAMVASTNTASMQLHLRAGFHEILRRHMLQLDL